MGRRETVVSLYVTCTQEAAAEQEVAALTSAILQHRLHGALPVRRPADAGRTRDLVLNGPPALPEVHLVVIVHQEESCRGETEKSGAPAGF